MRSYHLDGLEKARRLEPRRGGLGELSSSGALQWLCCVPQVLVLRDGRQEETCSGSIRGLPDFCANLLARHDRCVLVREGNEFKPLKELLGNAEAIVDGGSYVGLSALALAKMFPESKIIAIEPVLEI